MTTPQLVDPQLEAFWASDPSLLPTASGQEGGTQKPKHHTRTAIELGAAFYVVSKLVRAELAKHPISNLLQPHSVATTVFDMYRDVFVQLATPPVRQAFDDGGVQGLTGDELDQLTSDYVTNLGDYLSTTSADALVAGINAQIVDRWDAQIAFQRASMAYGLDRRGMLGYITTVLSGGAPGLGQLVSNLSLAFADKGLVDRAETIGDAESHTATETGKALSWMFLQRKGGLPANALREWDTSHLEDTCGICVPMDRVQVPLDQPFDTPAGKMWGPQAHPNCQCRVKLVVPIAKADPKPQAATKEHTEAWDADLHPKGYHGWFTETTPAEAPAATEEATGTFAGAATGTFATAAAGTFQSADIGTFTAQQGFTLPAGFTEITGLAIPVTGQFQRRGRPNIVVERTVEVPLPKFQKPIPLGPGRRREDFFAPADEFNTATNTELGTIYGLATPLSFDSVLPDSPALNNGVLAEHHDSPWDALDPDLAFKGRADGKNVDFLLRSWHDVIDRARPVWGHVVNHPEMYLNRLDTSELSAIAQNAGRYHFSNSDDGELDEGQTFVQGDWDYAKQQWPKDDLGSRIRRAVYRSITDDRADSSLGDAYGDYVTYQHPLWVGEGGSELASALDQIESDRNGVDFSDLPIQQVFAFDQGWHPGDHHAGRVTPTGEYIVNGIEYRSALGDYGPRDMPRMFSIGLQIAHVAAFTRPEGTDLPGQPPHWVPTNEEYEFRHPTKRPRRPRT